MTELERLIQLLPSPAPSQQLDERISKILKKVATDTAGNQRPKTLSQGVWSFSRLAGVCTVSAAVLGFLIGRFSVPVNDDQSKLSSSSEIVNLQISRPSADIERTFSQASQSPVARSEPALLAHRASRQPIVIFDDSPEAQENLRQYLVARPPYESLWGNTRIELGEEHFTRSFP